MTENNQYTHGQSPTPYSNPQQNTPYMHPAKQPSVLSALVSSMSVTILLLALNIIIYIVSELFFPSSLIRSLALSNSGLEHGRWWTLLSYQFLHSGLSHVLNNMISLIYVGSRLESRLGSLRYLAIYLITGVAAGFFFVITNSLFHDHSLVVGASGSIFGLFGAYGYYIVQNHMRHGRGDGSPVTEIQVALFIFFVLENIVYGLSDVGVANSCHIGGLISGILLASFLIDKNEI